MSKFRNSKLYLLLLLALVLTACGTPSVISPTVGPTTTKVNIVSPTPLPSKTPTLNPTLTPTTTAEPIKTPYLLPTESLLPTVAIQPSLSGGELLRSEACQFSVVIPQDWEVVNDTVERWYQHPSVGDCVFGVRPSNWEQICEDSDISLGPYPIVIVVATAPASEVSHIVFLEQDEGDWFVLGRQSFRAPADVSYLNSYLYVNGRGAFGMTTKDTGSYAGLGIVYRSLLWDGANRTALFEEIPTGSDTYLEGIVRSFAFE